MSFPIIASTVPAPGFRPLYNLNPGDDVPAAQPQSLPVGPVSISYNGVTFGPLTSGRIRVEPTSDEARTIKIGTRFTLEVTSTVTGETPLETDLLIDAIRQAITVNGGPLVVYGVALGRHFVNNGDGVWDVMNGPWSGPMVMTQHGGITAEFTWSVSWFVPDCTNAVYNQDLGFLFHNYSVSYSQDEAGYTTRTISGRLVVPQHRLELGGRIPSAWADLSREYLLEKFPLQFANSAFRRTYPSFSVSEDRSRLTYTIVDTEMYENLPPPGCVRAEAEFSASTQGAALVRWGFTLTAEYEVVKGGSIQAAVDGFLGLLGEKMQFSIDVPKIDLQDAGLHGIIPTGFSMRHKSIYGRKVAAFAAGWNLVASLKNVLEKAGIWSPVSPDVNDHAVWVDSLSETALHIRGLARLGDPLLSEEDEAFFEDDIQNLCRPPLLGESSELTVEPYEDEDDPEYDDDLTELLTPDREISWLFYEQRLEVEQDDGTIELRTLPTEPLTSSTDLTGAFDAMNQSVIESMMDGVDPPEPGGTGSIIDTISTATAGSTWAERRVRPARTLYLVGRAGRYGYPIPQPRLDAVKIGTQSYSVIQANREEAGEGFVQQSRAVPVVPTVASLPPVYEAVWRLRYVLTGDAPKGTFKEPPSPYTGGGMDLSGGSSFAG